MYLEMQGTYILIIRVLTPKDLDVGKLGKIHFDKGLYAYVGSGMRGLEGRIKRHLRRKKKNHWHIDYLLAYSEIIDLIILETRQRCECEVASRLSAQFSSIKNFGSSDCRCSSHLFFLGKEKARLDKIVTRLWFEVPCLGPSQGLDDATDIRGILFDLDGTLTVPGALDFPAIKQEMGCPPHIPILEYISSRPVSEQDRLYSILERHEAEAAEKSTPNEGAEQFLGALRDRGYKLGIITRNRMPSVEKALSKFRGVKKEDFCAIITRESALPKPHPDGVQKAAKLMGITPRQLLVVGDYRFDIIAGKAAGARTALLRNSGLLEPELEPLADYKVNNLKELLGYL
ncbi:MAG: hypothetical protein DRH12_03605 [Deltaproteobacteria bacterium]|nr:MAG: hypothetical protein DRH12_03605 [Deltaproteobacteria bacterium]